MIGFPSKNWVTLIILRVLNDSPMHGYKLLNNLNESGYLLEDKIETGTLYTTLRRLEKKKLLTSKWENPPNERRRRVYSITDSGVSYLKEIIESIIERKPMIEDLVEYYNEKL